MGLGIGCSDGEGGSTATLNSLDAGSGGPACENGRKDPIETDVDCGGGRRLKCAVGKHCGSNRDCETNLCIDDMCVAPSCTDGIKNGLEIDVDCGGTCPNKCKNGQRCAQAQDCEDGSCQSGQCRAPGCGDGIKNGTESDVDCGGACAPCANARSCNVDIDCQSGACSSAKCIVKPMLSSITPSYAATGGGSKISFTGPTEVHLVDLNVDGKLDVVCSGSSGVYINLRQ